MMERGRDQRRERERERDKSAQAREAEGRREADRFLKKDPEQEVEGGQALNQAGHSAPQAPSAEEGESSPSLFWRRMASTSLQYSLLASKGILA